MLATAVQVDAVVDNSYLHPQSKLLVVGPPIRHCHDTDLMVVADAEAEAVAVGVDPTHQEGQEDCQLVDTVFNLQRFEEEGDVEVAPKGMRGGLVELTTAFLGM